jgi:ABC-type lipoprotein release transport system permease subunit
MIFLFADDTTLIDSDSAIDTLVFRANVGLKKKLFITEGPTHKLSLQPDETKIMIFFNGNFANVDNITFLIDLNNYSNQNNMPPPLEYLLTSLQIL